MLKKGIKTSILFFWSLLVANCISFGQDQLNPRDIIPQKKKIESTLFIVTMKNYNAYGVNLGVSQGEVNMLLNTMVNEINSCNCFKDALVRYELAFDQDKLPKNKNVIHYDIVYRVTTNPALMFLMNFISISTFGIIPSGYRMEVTTDIKVFNKKFEEVKLEKYQNQASFIGGLSILLAMPFVDRNKPYILNKVTADLIANLANAKTLEMN